MSTLKISDIPTLARWTEVGVTENDNSLNRYIDSLKDTIGELVWLEDNNTPLKGEEPSREYTIINKSCRLLANMLSDIKAIRREVRTAKLLYEAGIETKKGGAV